MAQGPASHPSLTNQKSEDSFWIYEDTGGALGSGAADLLLGQPGLRETSTGKIGSWSGDVNIVGSRSWWHKPIIPVTQETGGRITKFEASLGNLMRPVSKDKKGLGV